MMNNIIKDLKNLYIENYINHNIINKNIMIISHKDRVGFFVVKKNENSYLLLKYWNINNNDIYPLSKLYSKINWIINLKVLEIKDKYILVETNDSMSMEDFLMYIPDYYIKDWFLYWPYLDNLISRYIYDKLDEKTILYQSIDEESKLTYSKIPECNTTIVIDTIWQDYIENDINLDKLYLILNTKFTKNISLFNSSDLIKIDLDLNFKLEIDYVIGQNKYYLLCPIINWHWEKSWVNLKTIELFLYNLNLLIKEINDKNNTCII